MNQLTVAANDGDHSLGPENAPVTLIEYGRYDCPHCKQALITLGEVRRQLDKPVRLIYRHFPQETPRSQSQRAAEAAEAAGNQGKFWEMHTRLLENQHALDDAGLIASAAIVGVNTAQFAGELESGANAETVRAQFRSGLESGVRSTPTFFINGVRHDGEWDAESLLDAIRASLR